MPSKEMAADDLAKLVAEAQDAQEHGLPPPVRDLDDDESDEEVEAADAQRGVPDWARVPEGFRFPEGWVVWFVRFPARMTNKPRGGERQCILWNLSEADEKRAAKFARGDGNRIIDEMAKTMIRSIDGKRVRVPKVTVGAAAAVTREDGEGDAVDVATFWNEIGGKGRYQIKNLYLKNHTMDPVENADFFENCVAPRSVG